MFDFPFPREKKILLLKVLLKFRRNNFNFPFTLNLEKMIWKNIRISLSLNILRKQRSKEDSYEKKTLFTKHWKKFWVKYLAFPSTKSLEKYLSFLFTESLRKKSVERYLNFTFTIGLFEMVRRKVFVFLFPSNSGGKKKLENSLSLNISKRKVRRKWNSQRKKKTLY